jgi:hypothetical protein
MSESWKVPEQSQPDSVHPAAPLTAPLRETASTGLAEKPSVSDEILVARAQQQRASWRPAALDPKDEHREEFFADRLKGLRQRLRSTLAAYKPRITSRDLTPALELLESSRLLESVLEELDSVYPQFLSVPYIVARGSTTAAPRVLSLAEQYTVAVDGIWSPESLSVYVGEVQQQNPLLLAEVLLLPSSLRLAQAELVLDRAQAALKLPELPSIEQSPFSNPLHSLRRLGQYDWESLLESLTAFHSVLAQDPAGIFLKMEPETRTLYRMRIAELAERADGGEMQTAHQALDLARASQQRPPADPRLAWRMAHIGYYLFEEGLPELTRRIGHHPTAPMRFRQWLTRYGSDAYIASILILSLLIIVALIAPLVSQSEFWLVIVALFLALLPATQGASDLVNAAVSSLLSPRPLPKLDFSRGIPADQTTFVVVPTLLLNEKQVASLFDDLEARYIANRDPNLHFGVLTDLPDSTTPPTNEERNVLLELSIRHINHLNAKYEGYGGGSFLLLHRHRVFNSRQGVWMGWERKRGKLLDLNRLLMGEYDSFPIKTGPRQVLERVRYIITLDSDTQLPHGTAARMIGAIAHPLNQGIVHPQLRIVTAGYGILQPRVGVSVASASRSRFAALYSGETGYDIYTRAVSDVYQDLFGEGTFTGKGIYEVSILHRVLNHRFPRNVLLSHDLIEGAYARAGLVSDIEVIDDYPSHHSAYVRRNHRWVRGDWQITQWLFNRVPDESNKFVANPISAISRWKIFDNLRRSLIEPITMLLLILGWFVLPGGPSYWTIVTVLLMIFPSIVQLGFSWFRAALAFSSAAAVDGLRTFFSSFGFFILNITFLPHQTLLSLDAIVRALVRRYITGQRLLEWETAAQAESSVTGSSLDTYLRLSPLVAVGIAIPLALTHPRAIYAASPILFLWAIAPLISGWLNSSPPKFSGKLSREDQDLLHRTAYATWRYFSEFGGEANHWLIPDNVEEKSTLQIRKLSPTNFGMLLNSRQAALELGFLTLPEFTHATLGSLATYERLEKKHGHLFNWYDIESLQPVAPLTISTVDSGNLQASLYALHGGARELLGRPLLSHSLFRALDQLSRQEHLETSSSRPGMSLSAGLAWFFGLPIISAATEAADKARESGTRQRQISAFLIQHLPWLLPSYTALLAEGGMPPAPPLEQLSLARARLHADALISALESEQDASRQQLAAELIALLPAARQRLEKLQQEIEKIAADSERFAEEMHYNFLFIESRQLLSIGFDIVTDQIHSACYDLLASEARIAFFLAVAKGDIPQKAWFRLDRSHVLVGKEACLLSWTGTMFEYLMPTLWMRSFPDTLIARALEACVSVQREHVRGIPWGISESGFAELDPAGRYSYQAWGIPQVALKYGAEDGPVISPYSTFLALPIARQQALANLHRMAKLGWIGEYGFYEAADYIHSQEPRMVRSWMAHHQGMSLAAIANLLCGNAFQRWFHNNVTVRAAEFLLHERPLAPQTLKSLESRKPL